jgi:diacylglycerol kinase family enzyme
VAAILNASAGGVTPAVTAHLLAELGEDLWVTRTPAEAERAMDAIVARGVEALCIGGGDGSFVFAVNALAARAARPVLLALRLGTGNAMPDVCGAAAPTARGLRLDLERARREVPRSIRLLTVDGRLTHSAGFGIDAAFNEDLDRIAKAGRRRRWARPLFAGAAGLAITAAARTVPRLVRGYAPRVRITATGPATQLDRAGRAASELTAGAMVRAAPTTLACCSTVPTYGRGVVMFPHTERHADRFQLRCATVGATVALYDLARVVARRDAGLEGVVDYLVTSIAVEVEDGCPAHIGGEVWRPTGAVRIAIARDPISILRARPSKHAA